MDILDALLSILSKMITFMNFVLSEGLLLLYTAVGMELVLALGALDPSVLDKHRLCDFLVGCGVYGPAERRGMSITLTCDLCQ